MVDLDLDASDDSVFRDLEAMAQQGCGWFYSIALIVPPATRESFLSSPGFVYDKAFQWYTTPHQTNRSETGFLISVSHNSSLAFAQPTELTTSPPRHRGGPTATLIYP